MIQTGIPMVDLLLNGQQTVDPNMPGTGLPLVDQLLNGRQSVSESLAQGPPQGPPGPPPGFFDKADAFLEKPSGQFLVNLLAQSGFSPIPQSPIGAVGRAALQTRQQGIDTRKNDLTTQLIESQIGLNQAKAGAEGQDAAQNAATTLGKLTQDLTNGVISPQDYTTRRNQILQETQQRGFDNEKVLREEFGKRTKGITDSLQSVSQAEALLATSQNPIADMAAFVSLIQSIDNSTVREGELRTYGSVSGIIENLKSLAGRAAGEGAFSPEIRENIAESIRALKGNLNQMHGRFADFYGDEAERFDLSRDAVTFGGAKPEFTPPTVAAPTVVPQANQNSSSTANNAQQRSVADEARLQAEIVKLEQEVAALEAAQNGE